MKALLAAAFLAAFFVSAASAQQQPPCFPTEQVGPMLEEQYGETLQSYGLGHNGQLFLLFGNEETGTWTLFGAVPSGKACILATGENYREPEFLGGREA